MKIIPSYFALVVAVAVTAVACSSSDSSAGTPVGGTCSSSATCGSGGVCATSQDFPNGYCTRGCQLSNAASCPSGSVCIDDASGVPADAGVSAICYQSCTSDADCQQQGFKCLEKASKKVCRHG